MSSALYKIDDTLISKVIVSVIPDYETIEVENKLLDGTIHIQTVGQPARVVNVNTVTVNTENKKLIDTCKATKTPVKVVLDDDYYIGIIRGVPSWARVKSGVFQVSLTLIVSEEGAV